MASRCICALWGVESLCLIHSCCLSLEYNTPNDSFCSAGIHSTRCKTNRKSCKSAPEKKVTKGSIPYKAVPITLDIWITTTPSGVQHAAPCVSHPFWEIQLSAAARQLNLRWCWDTWCSRNLWCWFSSDCGTHKDRSGGCSARWHRWHPYTEMCWDKDPLQPNLCLPQRLSASFGHYQRLGDSHWGRCLCRVRRASPWASLWRTMGMEPFLRRASLTSIPPKSYHIHSKR